MKVVEVAAPHRGRVAKAMLTAQRAIDRRIDVRIPHHPEDRHQRTRAGRRGDSLEPRTEHTRRLRHAADRIRDERCVLADKTAVDVVIGRDQERLELTQVLALDQVRALAAHRVAQRVGHLFNDQHLFFSDTDDVVVQATAQDDPFTGGLNISRLIHHTGRVTRLVAIALFPEFIAALTTAPPPVTTTSNVPWWVISLLADSIVGSSIRVSRLFGPPPPMMAWLRSAINRAESRFAAGCTLNTAEFPAAMKLMALHKMVSVGLVQGVMAAITPKGAYSCRTSPSSPVRTQGVRISVPGVFVATRRFLTILSSTREPGLFNRLLREALDLIERAAHRLDDALTIGHGQGAQATLSSARRPDCRVEIGKDAGASAACTQARGARGAAWLTR